MSPTWSEGEVLAWGSASTSIANIRRVSMKGGVGRVCRDLGLDNFHGWLYTLERLFSKRVAILVWVELFGQFPVKLGESGFGHCLHALFDKVFRSINELINQEDLVYLSLLPFFIVNLRFEVLRRKFQSFLIYFFFTFGEVLQSGRLLTRRPSEFLLHRCFGFREKFLLNFGEVLALLLFFQALMSFNNLLILLKAWQTYQRHVTVDPSTVAYFCLMFTLRATKV